MRVLMIFVSYLLLQSVFAAQQLNDDANKSIHGIWDRKEALYDGMIRFYYFHPGGEGLYRYGRKEANFTEAFQYTLEKNTLRLHWKSRDVVNELTLQCDTQKLLCTFQGDPKEHGQSILYQKRQSSRDEKNIKATKSTKERQWARMWTHYPTEKDKSIFEIYQFEKPALDGRGVGWFHQGKHGDWSTEALRYHKLSDRVIISFEAGDRSSESRYYFLENEKPVQIKLCLTFDPKHYWQERCYLDEGPTLESATFVRFYDERI